LQDELAWREILVDKVKEFIANDYVDPDEDERQDYDNDDYDAGSAEGSHVSTAAASCSRDGM